MEELIRKYGRLFHYVLLALLMLAFGAMGWHLSQNREAEKLRQVEEKLEQCENDAQQVIRDGQESAGIAGLLDQQLLQAQTERKQIKKQYEDSMRIIRAMLPDAAERAITDHYRRQQRR